MCLYCKSSSSGTGNPAVLGNQVDDGLMDVGTHNLFGQREGESYLGG